MIWQGVGKIKTEKQTFYEILIILIKNYIKNENMS